MHDQEPKAVPRRSVFPTPVRLGHFLLRKGVKLSCWPDVPYRGIDHLPYTPAPEQEAQFLAAGRDELVQLWNSYWDALESGELNSRGTLARGLQREFRSYGYDFDLAYAEILEIPDHLEQYPHGDLWLHDMQLASDHLYRIHRQINRRPNRIMPLGVDISHPTISFHSAIHQPGLYESIPDLPRYLNSNGLFPDIDSAQQFIHEANAMDYGPYPFCGIQIWDVP